jgi:hypothetical protein
MDERKGKSVLKRMEAMINSMPENGRKDFMKRVEKIERDFMDDPTQQMAVMFCGMKIAVKRASIYE